MDLSKSFIYLDRCVMIEEERQELGNEIDLVIWCVLCSSYSDLIMKWGRFTLQPRLSQIKSYWSTNGQQSSVLVCLV